MNLKDIVTLFKNHQIQYGLNGDSNLEELYKWELVSKQNGHPDPNAVDFSKEINSLVKMSLLPSTEIKGRKKEPSSRNTSMANLKISLPISKIKVSKKKNKKSFLSFITTLVRAQKAFSYLFKIERVSRRLSA